LIDTHISENKQNSFDVLYSFLESYFDRESYSLDYFCKIYLRKCKDKGIFEIFIDYLRKNLLYQNNYIENENDLFIHMVFLRTSDMQLNTKLWEIWIESFKELNQKIQELLLYHLKLVIDRTVDENVVNYGAYEDALFNSKYQYDEVTIEYRCLKCDSVFCIYNQMFTIDYLQKLFRGIKTERIFNTQNEAISCNQCNQKTMSFTII
jgi:hypothetical protein